MKFTARKTQSQVTTPVLFAGELFGGWKVTVRYLSPHREAELRKRATVDGKVSLESLYALIAEEVLVGWEGCRPLHIEALVEMGEDSDKLEVDAGGFVPFSVPLAAFLLNEENVRAQDFQSPILQTARYALQVSALEKKRKSEGSSTD